MAVKPHSSTRNAGGPQGMPFVIKAFIAWGGLLVASLAYANYYGIRILDSFSSRTVQHGGAPGAVRQHK